MQSQHVHVLDTFVRVQRFLDDKAQIVVKANRSSYRMMLDDVVMKLSEHAVTQTGARRASRGYTAKERVVRNALKINHMRPIAAVTEAMLRDVPEFNALKMPPQYISSRALIAWAGAMGDAVSRYQATFVAAGFDSDFIAQLRRAAEQLSETIADRGETRSAQAGATAGLSAECTRGRQAVRVLDALVEPQLGGNVGLLAEWKACKQFGGRRVPIAITSLDAAAKGLASVPAAAPAKLADVRDVMSAVPSAQVDERVDRDDAPYRVAGAASEVVGSQPVQQIDEARVDRVDERQGDVDGHRGRVGELGPWDLVPRLYLRSLFGEGDLHARVQNRVRISDMMHDLTNRPAVGAIRRVELSERQTGDGVAKTRGKRGDVVDGSGAGLDGMRRKPLVFTDWVAQREKVARGNGLHANQAEAKRVHSSR